MDLWVHDFKTNVDAQITRDGGVSGPAWSPDGAHIAYLVDSRGVEIATVRRDEHQFQVTKGGGSNEIGRPSWAPGCKSVAVGLSLVFELI